MRALGSQSGFRQSRALLRCRHPDRSSPWARKIQRLLRRACHATNLTRDQGVPLTSCLIALVDPSYGAIFVEGLAYHEAQELLISAADKARRRGRQSRRVGHTFLLRLHDRKQDVLRFLTIQACPSPTTKRSRMGNNETPAEDFRRVPTTRGGRGLRAYPTADLNREKARRGWGGHLDRRSRTADRRATNCLSRGRQPE
jgi:hypothetical protein